MCIVWFVYQYFMNHAISTLISPLPTSVCMLYHALSTCKGDNPRTGKQTVVLLVAGVRP